MDSLDLLAREDEFKKLNKELEKKTQSLIKKIEHAMQKQDIFSEFSPNLTLTPSHTKKKHSCATYQPVTPPNTQKTNFKKNGTEVYKSSSKLENTSSNSEISSNFEKETACSKIDSIGENVTTKYKKIANGIDNINTNSEGKSIEESRSRNLCDCCVNRNHSEGREFLYAFVSVNVKEKVLPQSFLKDRPSVESVCKFLSSKIKLLQEQIDGLQSAINKKASQCNLHLTQLAELEGERLTLLNRCNGMKSSTAEMKAKYMALQSKCEEKEKLFTEQLSLADKLSCEVKQLRTKTGSLEAKCATHQNTVELLTQQLETIKRSEKEFRNSTRTLSASHQNVISRLEAQLKVQAARMDKQMALIDNLRRQNVLLSTDASVKALEKEYSDYLQKDF